MEEGGSQDRLLRRLLSVRRILAVARGWRAVGIQTWVQWKMTVTLEGGWHPSSSKHKRGAAVGTDTCREIRSRRCPPRTRAAALQPSHPANTSQRHPRPNP